jgi:pyridoxal phosphate enzyme (YggS family)
VAERVALVRERIATAGGDPAAVRLVAVTKGFGPQAVEAAMAAGVADIAESYAQELVAKSTALAGPPRGPDAPRWHFIGRLQSNKVKALGSLVALWQSVDRSSLVHEIAERAPGAHVLVQVNVSGEARKGGCAPADAAVLAEQGRQAGLQVAGLMAIGATGSAEQSRPGFRLLTELADRLELRERSMGMSDDFEVSVEEGSTMVRLGRALFGPRPAELGTAGKARALTSRLQEEL